MARPTWTVVEVAVPFGQDEETTFKVLRLEQYFESSLVTIQQVIPDQAGWEAVGLMVDLMVAQMHQLAPSGSMEGDDAS